MNVWMCLCIYRVEFFPLSLSLCSSLHRSLSLLLSVVFIISSSLDLCSTVHLNTFHFDCLRPKSKSDYGQETNETNHEDIYRESILLLATSIDFVSFSFSPSHTTQKIMGIMTGTAASNLVVSHHSMDIVFFLRRRL